MPHNSTATPLRIDAQSVSLFDPVEYTHAQSDQHFNLRGDSRLSSNIILIYHHVSFSLILARLCRGEQRVTTCRCISVT